MAIVHIREGRNLKKFSVIDLFARCVGHTTKGYVMWKNEVVY